MQTLKKISLFSLCLLLAGCIHMYRPNIQQGNVITPDMLVQLKPDLNAEQVRYIMGTPVLQDNFNPNRWDYVYTYQPGGGKMTEQRVTLYFDANGMLTKIEKPAEITGTTLVPQTVSK